MLLYGERRPVPLLSGSILVPIAIFFIFQDLFQIRCPLEFSEGSSNAPRLIGRYAQAVVLYGLGCSFWLSYRFSRRHDPRFNHLYGYHYSSTVDLCFAARNINSALLGLYVSGMTGGSFSAILLNIPEPSAAAQLSAAIPWHQR